MAQVDHAQLARLRVSDALGALNEALAHAQLAGLLVRVSAVGLCGAVRAEVVLMRPVDGSGGAI